MAEEELKVGDNVRLKSGGPTMNIAHIGSGEALCTWFDAASKHQTKGFVLAQLERVLDDKT